MQADVYSALYYFYPNIHQASLKGFALTPSKGHPKLHLGESPDANEGVPDGSKQQERSTQNKFIGVNAQR
jgi:hypothetical protein